MSQPKRRHSRSRSRLRRNALAKKLIVPTQKSCPECGVPIEPYTACKSCGSFKGKRQVIKPRSKTAK